MTFNLISTGLIAVALAMDAFSVSMTKGFTQKNITKTQILYYGIFFGGFQALMPILGYFFGNFISSFIASLASVVGFILLLAIGLNMIRESLKNEDDELADTFSFKEVTLLAIDAGQFALPYGDPAEMAKAIMDISRNNRNSRICIQHCRNIHRKKDR